MDRIIRGRLVLPGGREVNGELGVVDGRIAAIAEAGRLRGDELLDASGSLVLPGVVDVHAHMGSEPSEGVARATRAAAAGGVTTLVDMPFDASGPLTSIESFQLKAESIERFAIVDVAIYGTIPPGGSLEDVTALVDAGVAAFKLSTLETDPRRFPRSSDHSILCALRRLGETRVLTAFHCENDEIVVGLIRSIRASGSVAATSVHAAARPPVAETAAIACIIELAAATAAPVHVCHVTTERGVELIRRARADGVDITAETCTHYLLLDETEVKRAGARAKVNPPLRSRDEVEALWRGLASGALEIVSSDHVGWTLARKDGMPILDAAAGIPGLELTLPLLFSEGVVRRGLPLARLLEVLCERPARRYRLWPAKGALAVGADADVAVLDPAARWRVDDARMAAAAGWSPYHGREVTGRVTAAFVRGETVLRDGEVVGRSGHGCLVRPVRR